MSGTAAVAGWDNDQHAGAATPGTRPPPHNRSHATGLLDRLTGDPHAVDDYYETRARQPLNSEQRRSRERDDRQDR